MQLSMAGSGEGLFDSYVHIFFLHLHLYKRKWIHDLMVTRQQLYRCAKASTRGNESWPHDRKAAALPLRQDSPSLLIYVYLINKPIKIINMC
jgi:hypothetical protein